MARDPQLQGGPSRWGTTLNSAIAATLVGAKTAANEKR